MKLLDERVIYKPFYYPWCHEAFMLQQQAHWIPEEVPLADDVADWIHNLTREEKHLLSQIFRFFTQADIDVFCGYVEKYLKLFKHHEVRMMLTSFANIECIHIEGYSYLLDTVGMDETEYGAFLEYDAMRKKHEYLSNFNIDNHLNIAKSLAVYGAFSEGMQLFASFAMLLHFPRVSKMKGMGQIITWSVRDETLHTLSIIKLYNTFVREYGIDKSKLSTDIREIANVMVNNEFKFIDLAFELGDFSDKSIYGRHVLLLSDLKNYVKYICDLRLKQLGLTPIFNMKKHPLPWLEETLLAPNFVNFFENVVTDYSKCMSTGKWEDVALDVDYFKSENYEKRKGNYIDKYIPNR